MSGKETKKNDLRSRYTRQVLSESLVSLIQEKPFEKVTVKELCEKAAVNRATFYTYYSDIHDLMGQLWEDMKDYICRHVKSMNTGDAEQHREAMVDYLRYMRENEQLYFLLVGENGPNGFREQTWLATKEVYLGRGSGDKIADLKKELLLANTTYGITAMIEHWMIKGMPLSDQDLADLIIGIMFPEKYKEDR